VAELEKRVNLAEKLKGSEFLEKTPFDVNFDAYEIAREKTREFESGTRE